MATDSIIIDDNILEETNQVLNQFKHDGSCDHTSELSPVALVWLLCRHGVGGTELTIKCHSCNW